MDEKESILIADDDESTCRTLSLIFGKRGYETETAGTGREAVEKAQERFFNVALVDIRLPDMEGVELLAPLKKIHPDMAVIMITAYASLETAMRALNEGASAYITKPLNMDEVLTRVREALEKQQAQITKESKTAKLTIFVVAKQPIFRQGIRQALSSHEDMEVVGEFDLTTDALSQVESLLPDIVLMDIGMSLVAGLGLARQIAVRCPRAAVVALASSLDDDQLFQAIKSGVVAFLSEDIAADELARVLRHIGRGEYPINKSLLDRPNTARQVLQLFQSLSVSGMDSLIAPLSQRETEILKYIAEGNPNKRIAHTLGIAEQTIKNHVTSILRKLNANDRTHAVVLAIRSGWLNVSEISEPQ